jgi:hypothetical protein
MSLVSPLMVELLPLDGHSTGLLSRDNGINLSDTHIRIPNGGYISNSQSSWNNPTSSLLAKSSYCEVQRYMLRVVGLRTRALGVNTTLMYMFQMLPLLQVQVYRWIPMESPSLMEPIKTTAASGSTITAGAGMTLAGSTLGIDPTAVVHVAGISS